MRGKIFVRVDANHQIGLGHVVRCIALAQMLKDHFEIHFVSKEAPATTISEIEESGFFYTLISSESSFFNLLSSKDFVVLDHYGLDSAYQKKIKETGCRLICIDDLHDKEFYADLIINHAPGVKVEDYKAQPYTQFALGSDYALLRPAFLEAATAEKGLNTMSTLLICFGGSDIRNLTLKTLRVAIEFADFKSIIVITGAAYSGLAGLQVMVAADPRIQHYHAVEAAKMVDLFQNADLSVVPSSGVLLEALAAGKSIVSGMYIENQKFLFENYKKANAFFSADDFSDASLRNAIKKSFEQKIHPVRLIDGKSKERLKRIFVQLQTEQRIHLRKALSADLKITYQWATDKTIRAHSFSQSEITLKEHSNWFLTKVESQNCYYYLAEWENAVVGSIRFDLKGEDAVISYLVDPQYHNKGLGIILLKKGIMSLLDNKEERIKNIVGFVMPRNIASCKAFEKLSFTKTEEGENYKYTLPIHTYANR